MVPNRPPALIETDKAFDTPEGPFKKSTESLIHAVAKEHVPPKTVLCEIPVMANFRPMMVELTDPEAGDTETEKNTTGILNDAEFVTKDTKFNETLVDNFGPYPIWDLETMEDSDNHKWNSPADDPRRIFGEYDA
jgi:hypothetical protein